MYDSLSKVTISNDLTRRIAPFSFCKEDKMYIGHVDVQQQKKGVDCGLFATVFVNFLAYGNGPGKIAFEPGTTEDTYFKMLNILRQFLDTIS